jgi:hypothetical protein
VALAYSGAKAHVRWLILQKNFAAHGNALVIASAENFLQIEGLTRKDLSVIPVTSPARSAA